MKNSIQTQRQGKRILLHPNVFRNNHKLRRYIAVPMAHEIEMITIDDLIYLKSESNYTHLHLQDGRHLIASMTLKVFECYLKGNEFLRIHNQYLINGKRISTYLTTENQVILSREYKIPVSRNRKYLLTDFLKSFMIQSS